MRKNVKKIVALLSVAASLFISSISSVNATHYMTVNAASSTPSILYQSHVQNYGDQGVVSNGATSGTEGQSLRLEYVNVCLTNASGGIKIATHISCIGWKNYNSANAGSWVGSGTKGQSLAIEAVKFELFGDVANNYNIVYRIHSQNLGWGNWVQNGAEAGTTGRGLRAEAIQIKLVAKSNVNVTTTTYYVKTKGANLTVRSGPSTSYTSLGKLANGTSVSVYSISNGWAKIKFGSATGYVSSSYLTRNKTNTSTNQNTAGWRMPMDNAYCTWRSYSNMSWASYTNTGSGRNYHLGIDIYGSNSNVYAAANGKVVACSTSNSGANGRFIVIEHTVSGKTVYSFYAHLSSLNVSYGQKVSKGYRIAYAGGSGYGSNNHYGTHLHFAVVNRLNSNGSYYGYATYFTGNSVNYNGTTFYNPVYVVNNNRLP